MRQERRDKKRCLERSEERVGVREPKSINGVGGRG